MVAALATGKPEAEVSREERHRAKPVNFGLPGAMGPQGLIRNPESLYPSLYVVCIADTLERLRF
jgi:hypothetical protein